MKKGFTIIEVLVTMGIIAILVAVSLGGFSAATKSAEKAKCSELVSNVATAMTAVYQQTGRWPKRLAALGETGGRLDANAAFAFVSGGVKYLSLSVNDAGTALSGVDKFGIVTPWAADAIRKAGAGASLATAVGVTGASVEDHVLWAAVDVDGDGLIQGASVGGESVDVRASAIVWCAGKDGVMAPYSRGLRADDIYSWSKGQATGVK